MESFSRSEAVTFGALQARLIRFVNNRISNGYFSERGLARILRVSQPQIHNVLKGARKLTPALGDRIMSALGITILDLLDGLDLNGGLPERHVELLSPGTVESVRLGSARLVRNPEFAKKSVANEFLPGKAGVSKSA